MSFKVMRLDEAIQIISLDKKEKGIEILTWALETDMYETEMQMYLTYIILMSYILEKQQYVTIFSNCVIITQDIECLLIKHLIN